MNKYEKELEKKEFFNLLLFSSNAKATAFLKNKKNKSKLYFYTKLKDDLLKIKKLKEEKNIVYSNYDIEFLKQFSGFDLTYEEAYLTGKTEEFYKYLRFVNNIIENENSNLRKKINQELNKLNGNYSPRLVLEFYNKYKKGSKN